MEIFDLIAVLTSLAAGFSWLNHRTLKLPSTIGLMGLGLVFSLVLVGLAALGFDEPAKLASRALSSVDFSETVLHGMLGALLFAGALHVDLDQLAAQRSVIASLASAGVLISTGLFGAGAWLLLGALGYDIPFLWCLAFGAVVAPTDPVAVLGILKHVRVPKTLEIKITGESLFNDGFAVVVFLVLAGLVSGEDASAARVVELLVVEGLGGIAFGLVLGLVAYFMLRSIDDYQVEILITLAIVTGGYALAGALHTSGPLAMVVAGLLIGNQGRRLAMSERTRTRLDSFWELVDEFLNAILFLLIGLEVLVMPFEPSVVPAALLCVALSLACRFIGVGLPVALLRRVRSFSPHAVKVLTWGGLRGGISVALALSLPASPHRDLIVTITYAVVAFSILVQGLSVAPLLRRLYPEEGEPRSAA